jgi:hypothetical protein
MPDTPPRRTNSALWLGVFFFLLAVVSNFLSSLRLSAAWLTWLNLVLPFLALLLLLIGVVRAFGQPLLYRGKILATSLAVLSLMLCAASAAFFTGARKIPASAGAPQIGQRVPDFTLPDSTGQPTTLAQLFSAAPGATQPPKAVLLVFYRGYW